MHGGIS
jgi:serine/threonine-protein phosphatase PP1 catalytic subunit